MSVDLTGLDGTNPLAFLAGLGALAALDRTRGTADPPRIRWVPGSWHAVVEGVASPEEVVERILADHSRLKDSPALQFSYDGVRDLKPPPSALRELLEAVATVSPGERHEADLVAAFFAEGGLDGQGKATKPTALHFTAGQQKFLVAVAEIAENLSADHVHEALFGPWRYESTLKTIGWDVADDRVYAYRAADPTASTERKRGIPGADWLAVSGLAFLPVFLHGTAVRTTGCVGSWKRGAFVWPLWLPALPPVMVRTVVGLPRLEDPAGRSAAWGIGRVCRSAIRRSDQGGYGTFAPPVAVAGAR